MILEMRDICKEFPLGDGTIQVLKHINLEVEEGSYLAIMGPSGSGKTTLMNLIGCLDVPTSGDYILAGNDITSCNDNELADIRNKDIGFVFQSFNLLPKLTAIENVALPLLYANVKKAERLERAKVALETVGLSDRLDFTSDRLSGGQCQRVAIARAIVGHPKILLADEPTGALDSTSGIQVMDLFHQLHEQGSTIIMITHDSSIADHADQKAYIFDGELIRGYEEFEAKTGQTHSHKDSSLSFNRKDGPLLEGLDIDKETELIITELGDEPYDDYPEDEFEDDEAYDNTSDTEISAADKTDLKTETEVPSVEDGALEHEEK